MVRLQRQGVQADAWPPLGTHASSVLCGNNKYQKHSTLEACVPRQMKADGEIAAAEMAQNKTSGNVPHIAGRQMPLPLPETVRHCYAREQRHIGERIIL